MESHDKLIAWIDIETTGLDPCSGVILELGIIMTTMDLEEVDRCSWVVRHDRSKVLAMMDDDVIRMHMDSGLLPQVWADSYSASKDVAPSSVMAIA